MAQGADQQRRTPASVWIGGARDVPPEPTLRLVADQLANERSTATRAQLDTTDLVVVPATIPGRADGDVLDAVAVEIARSNHHASVELARLASRPVPELLSGPGGVDANLAWKRPGLLFRRRRRHREVALAIAIEIGHRGHHPTEPTPRIRSLPVLQLLAARRREDPGPPDPRAIGVRGGGCPDGEIGAPVAVEIVEASDVPAE